MSGLYVQLFSIHGFIRGKSPELGRDADTNIQLDKHHFGLLGLLPVAIVFSALHIVYIVYGDLCVL